MPTAAAVVGAAVIGAVSSSKASKRGAAGAKKGRKGIERAAAVAREDVLKNIPIAQEQLLGGARGAVSTDLLRSQYLLTSLELGAKILLSQSYSLTLKLF